MGQCRFAGQSKRLVNPQTHQVGQATATVNSLLSGEGVRLMLTSVVRNFNEFRPGRHHPRGHNRCWAGRAGGLMTAAATGASLTKIGTPGTAFGILGSSRCSRNC